MRVSSRFFIIFGFFYLVRAESDEYPDEQSIVHIDVQRINPRTWKHHQSISNGEDSIEGAFKVQWTGNGDFQPHYHDSQSNLEPELPPWDSKIQTVHSETVSSDTERSLPSPVLQPPFEFYSSSINDFANEDTGTIPPNYENSSLENSSTIKTLRIYEITKSNTSFGFHNGNELTTGQRSFTISDPSSEAKSFDSLRSVIQNKSPVKSNSVNDNGRNDGRTNGVDDRSSDIIPRTNVIRTNSVKANALRGNRKYQPRPDSDETPVRRNSWGTGHRHNWRRRPVNRVNHFKFSDSGVKVGAVPGVPGRDYPIHQEHTHHHLRNVADRFPCPANPPKHFYLADRASRCQIFYVCYGSQTGVPMVCPNGTLFNQEIQVCDWWFNVVC